MCPKSLTRSSPQHSNHINMLKEPPEGGSFCLSEADGFEMGSEHRHAACSGRSSDSPSSGQRFIRVARSLRPVLLRNFVREFLDRKVFLLFSAARLAPLAILCRGQSVSHRDFYIFSMTAASQRLMVSPARSAISRTRAWLCFTLCIPVAIFVMQLTASTFMPI